MKIYDIDWLFWSIGLVIGILIIVCGYFLLIQLES